MGRPRAGVGRQVGERENKRNALPLKRILSQRLRRNAPRTSATDQVASSVAVGPPIRPAARIGAKLIENDVRSYSSNASSSDRTTNARMPAASPESGGPTCITTVPVSTVDGPIISASKTGKISAGFDQPAATP